MVGYQNDVFGYKYLVDIMDVITGEVSLANQEFYDNDIQYWGIYQD